MDNQRRFKWLIVAMIFSAVFTSVFALGVGAVWFYIEYVFSFLVQTFGESVAGWFSAGLILFITFTLIFYMAITEEERSR